MRWLISTDGTDRSHRAAHLAARFLRPGKDEAILLGILTDDNHETLRRSLDELQNQLGEFVRKRTVRRESPTAAIEAEAIAEQVDIAVYGSRGRRGVSKFLFGSVAARLAHDRPCSVLVVREPPGLPKKILICISASPKRALTVEMGRRLAQAAGAEVTVLHAISHVPLAYTPTEPLPLTAEEAIAQQTPEGQLLAEALAHLASREVPARGLIRHGLVLDETLAEIEEGGYGLVVIGAHRALSDARWSEYLMEDVASSILLNTRCPLVIV